MALITTKTDQMVENVGFVKFFGEAKDRIGHVCADPAVALLKENNS